MGMRQLTVKEKRLGAIALAVLLVFVVHNLLASPMIVKWRRLQERIEITESALKRNIKIIHLRKTIENQYAQLTTGRSGQKKLENPDIENWLQIVQDAAGSRVWIKHLRPRPEQTRASYRLQPAEVECTGNLKDIGRYIYDLVYSSGLVRIERFRLRPSASEVGELNCLFVVSRILVQ